jgi:hypothetical protein
MDHRAGPTSWHAGFADRHPFIMAGLCMGIRRVYLAMLAFEA